MTPSNHLRGPLSRLVIAANPVALVRNLWRHRQLISQFSRREIEGRYQGSFLGLLWSFVTPVAMLAIYTFVFGVVFKARWPDAHGDHLAGFALVMFAGQLAFQLVAELVGRSPGLIVAVPSFVKKVVFPLEILPVVLLIAALFHALIAIAILALASIAVYGGVPWTVVLAPVLVLPLALLGLGAAWFLAALGVYLRDIGNIASLAINVLFLATPIFYPLSAIPEPYRAWIALNPLAPGVEMMRQGLITGELPGLVSWAAATGTGAAVALAGYGWFMVTRRGFADVI